MYDGNTFNEKMAGYIEPLLKEHGVDVYFSGHVHSYERDYPVYGGQLEEGATTHIMVRLLN